MTESHAILLLLGLVTACAVATTAIFLMTAGDLRRVLRQIDRFFSDCDRTRKEAERTLGVAHRLLARADTTSVRIHSVIEKTCETAEALLGQFSFLKGKVVSLWPGHSGNGGRRPSRSRKVHRIGNHQKEDSA
jgi:hypothetical protein